MDAAEPLGRACIDFLGNEARLVSHPTAEQVREIEDAVRYLIEVARHTLWAIKDSSMV